MRLQSAPILIATLASVYGAGQPSITKPSMDDQKISGTFPVYDNCTPVLTLLIDNTVTIPVRVFVEPKRGEFKMELTAALKGGEKLKVKHACGQNPESTSDEVTIKVDDGTPPKIVSIAAVYGANKIRIFYGALKGVDSASLELKTCLEEQVYKLSAEDLKKTDLEIALTRGLFCEKDARAVSI